MSEIGSAIAAANVTMVTFRGVFCASVFSRPDTTAFGRNDLVQRMTPLADVGMQANIPGGKGFSSGIQSDSEIKIIKRGIASLKYFRIFNRWGQMLFDTTVMDQRWNEDFLEGSQQGYEYVYISNSNTKAVEITKTRKQNIKLDNIPKVRIS